MRCRCFVLLMAVIALPLALRAETIYMKDGSSLKGRLVKIIGDTLYFETSFGAQIRIPRDHVQRIEFVSPSGGQPTPVPQQVISSPATSAPPGTLSVSFEKMEFTSRIAVHRRRDRAGHERANRIALELRVDGVQLYSYIDSVTDKEVREGPDRILRNNMSVRDMKVSVPEGLHQLRITIHNSMAGEYAGAFIPGPLEQTVVTSNVLIRSGETTMLTIGRKRSKFGLGGSKLYVIE